MERNELTKFEEGFYGELRALGFEISTITQLQRNCLKYDVKIIPVFKKYLLKAEQMQAYYEPGEFAEYVQYMLLCLRSKNMAEMTDFLLERYKLAIKNRAPWTILNAYAKAICGIRDKRYLLEYLSLFSEEYIAPSSARFLTLLYDYRVKEIESLALRLLEHFDTPRTEAEASAFYQDCLPIEICTESMRVLGRMRSSKARAAIEAYTQPENKLDRTQFAGLDEALYDRYLQLLKSLAETTMAVINDEERQLEEDHYKELRELGYRINNSSQLYPNTFHYDPKIIPVFKKYLKKAETIKGYYRAGRFSNHVELMIQCLMHENMREMTPFFIERYKFALKNNAAWVVRQRYSLAICAMKDKRYVDEYFSLFTEEYIASSSACLLGLLYELKAEGMEKLLLRLLSYRDAPRENDYKIGFYGLGEHLWICSAAISILGKLKSQEALPYIKEYLEPKKKLERGDPKVFDDEDYIRYLKEVKLIAKQAIYRIEGKSEFLLAACLEYLLSDEIVYSGILEKIIEELPEKASKTKRTKVFKEKLKEAFFIEGNKYPRWVWDSEWPLSKTGKPTKFLRQNKKGEITRYYFLDVDTGEGIEIAQSY